MSLMHFGTAFSIVYYTHAYDESLVQSQVNTFGVIIIEGTQVVCYLTMLFNLATIGFLTHLIWYHLML